MHIFMLDKDNLCTLHTPQTQQNIQYFQFNYYSVCLSTRVTSVGCLFSAMLRKRYIDMHRDEAIQISHANKRAEHN